MQTSHSEQLSTPRPAAGFATALARTWAALLSAVASAMAILLAIITSVVLFEVAARYFFNSPTIWAVDFTEYALVYLTFLGSAWALHEHAHVRVDMLVRFLGRRSQLFLNIVVSLAAAGVMAVFVWVGANLVLQAYLEGQAMLKAWAVPRWLILLPIPVASLLMVLEFLRQSWERFQGLQGGALAEVHRHMEFGAVELEDERAVF